MAIREKAVSEGLGGFGSGIANRALFVAGDWSRSEDESTFEGMRKMPAAAAAEPGWSARDAEARAAEAAAESGSGAGKSGFPGREATRAAPQRAEAKAERKTEEMSASGAAACGLLMKVITEVVSISTSPAPAGSFEVPAGYELQKRN